VKEGGSHNAPHSELASMVDEAISTVEIFQTLGLMDTFIHSTNTRWMPVIGTVQALF
jgi:hypothetical protein